MSINTKYLIRISLFITLLYFIVFNKTQIVYGAACPVTDGGLGDGDSSPNGVITISTNDTWTADGTNMGDFDCTGVDILVTNNATLTLSSYDSGDTNYTNDYGVIISTDAFTISDGSTVSANGKGYSSARGPGVALSAGYCYASGSTYGGRGSGSSYGVAYGSVYQPTDLGSASPSNYGSNPGGGAIKIVTTGNLDISGTLSSDGTSGSVTCNGGGTGGSIYLDIGGTLSSTGGTGIIKADGKTSSHQDRRASAGGGRIAIHYTTDNWGIGSAISNSQIHAYGETTYNSGAGTIYVEHKSVDTSNQGSLYIDNNDISGSYAELVSGSYNFSKIYLTHTGHLNVNGSGSVLTIADNSIISGDSTLSIIYINGTFDFDGGDPLIVENYGLSLDGDYSGFNDFIVGSSEPGRMYLHANNWSRSGSYTFDEINVGAQGTLYMTGYDNGDTNYTNDYGVTVNATSIDVDYGGTISAVGSGYGSGRGPGAGWNGNCWAVGSSYGGQGTANTHGATSTYGDLYEPTDLGSSSATSYGTVSGAGAIKLVVSGMLTLEGTITVDGSTNYATCNGGSTAGSVYLDIGGTLADPGGTGEISADGKTTTGSSKSASSGGGRIAIYYTTDNLDIASAISESRIHAYGDTQVNSGAGTIYVEHKGVDITKQGKLYIDNNSISGRSAGLGNETYHFSEIHLTRTGHLDLGNTLGVLTIDNNSTISGDSTSTIYISGTFDFDGGGPLIVEGYNLSLDGAYSGFDDIIVGSSSPGYMILHANNWTRSGNYTFNNVTVGGNGILYMQGYDSEDTNYTNDYGVTLNASNVSIEPGGSISADGLGYSNGRGPGHGSGNYCTTVAPSYGGKGGPTGADTYGDWTEPNYLGSSSGNHYPASPGGGAIKIVSYNLDIEGTISANGAIGTSACNSGGSGGSVYIISHTLNGTSGGTITAEGRHDTASNDRGAGGGGRIAFYVEDDEWGLQDQINSGKISAAGGSGSGYTGYYGSVYVHEYDKGEPPIAEWTFDNGYGSTANDSSGNQNDLTISNATFSGDTRSGNPRAMSMELDGTNSYLYRNYDSDFDFGTGSFTVTGYFRHPSTISAVEYLASRFSSTGFKIYMNTQGQVCFGVDNDSSWTPTDYACSTSNYADSQWHHFSAVKNETIYLALYIDGIQVGSATPITDQGTLSGSNTLYIGVDSDGSSNKWTGLIDDITVFDYARVSPQVKTDYIGNQISTNFGLLSFDHVFQGVVGYWKMDDPGTNTEGETSTDSSTNNNTATLFGDDGIGDNNSGMNCTTSGKFGTACDFDGVDDYINAGSDPSLGELSAITYSAWINTSSCSGDERILYKGDTASSLTKFYLTDGYPAGSVGTDSVSAGSISNSTICDGDWHNVSMTYNDIYSRKVRLFVDGNEVNYSTQLTANGTHNSDSLSNLIISHSDTDAFTGKIDDLRVFNRTLSLGDIKQVYNWTPGPVGYWKMDEGTGTSSTNDSSGNLLHAILHNIPENNWTKGIYGTALDFDSTNTEYIYVDTGPELSISGPLTISAWIKPETNNSVVASKYDYGDDNRSWRLFINSSNNLEFTASSNGILTTTATSTSTLNVDGSIWYHVTGIYNGSQLLTYINGIQVGFTNYSNGINTGNENFAIGTDFDSGTETNSFDGVIDNVKVYNYARTPGRIIEDMNAGHPIVGSPIGSQVGYWKFDEGYGTTVHDNSVNENNGTLGAGDSAPSWTLDGKFGKALDFETSGTDDYVSLGSDSAIDLDGKSFTISLWTKRESTGEHHIFSKGDEAELDWVLDLYYKSTDNKLRFGFYGDDLDSQATFTDTGVWHHLAFTYDSSTNSRKIYIDGISDNSDTAIGDLSGTDDDRAFIGYATLVGIGFDGIIDEVKIYSDALTPDQVKLDYNQGKTSVLGSYSTDSSGGASWSSNDIYCPPGQGSTCIAPIGEWHMNEGSWTNDCSTETVYDSSGNEAHGVSCDNGMGPTETKYGKFGNAGVFDGNDDIVNIVDSTLFDFGTSTDFTLQTWVKIADKGSGAQVFFDDYSSVTGGFRVYYDDTEQVVKAFIHDSISQYCTIQGATDIEDEKWHMVTAVYNRNSSCSATGDIDIYIDGIKETTSIDFSNGAQLDDDIDVNGVDFSDETNAVKGQLDEIKIYNYTRTPAQIAWDYNKGQPIGWWKLDECQGTTAHDASVHGNDGTITIGGAGDNWEAGTCTSGDTTDAWYDGADGKQNASLDFDGLNDYIQIGDTTALRFDEASRDFSIFIWIKRDTTGEMNIFSKEDADNDGYRIQINSSNLVVCSVNSIDITSSATITDTYWHNIGCTIDRDGNGRVFIDAAADGSSVEISSEVMATTSNIRIGTRSYSSANYFNGQIDDVRIYNYPLSAEQIQTLYNEGAVSFW